MANAILKAFTAYKEEIESGQSVQAPPIASSLPPPPPPATPNPVLTKTTEEPPIKSENTAIYAKPILLNGQAKDANTPSPDPGFFSKPEFSSSNTPAGSTSSSPQREPKIITMKGSRAELDINISPNKNALSTPDSDANSIHFYVQMAASSKPLNLDQAKWQNTGHQIEVIIENNLYKYQIRRLGSFERAEEVRFAIRKQGFPDAFVVAYRYGQRIKMEEAKKELGMK